MGYAAAPVTYAAAPVEHAPAQVTYSAAPVQYASPSQVIQPATQSAIAQNPALTPYYVFNGKHYSTMEEVQAAMNAPVPQASSVVMAAPPPTYAAPPGSVVVQQQSPSVVVQQPGAVVAPTMVAGKR